jgi:pantetheine-phosphate adenylyltransferase
MNKLAIYPGSFDPVTLGHQDLINRSLHFVERLIVGVAVNTVKDPLFTHEERMQLLQEVTAGQDRVEVKAFQGLLVDFAREVGASMVVRGLRAVSDFDYEFQMALMNRQLMGEPEFQRR